MMKKEELAAFRGSGDGLVKRLRDQAQSSGHVWTEVMRLLLEAADALEDHHYADLEHEHLGCHTVKTGIYAAPSDVFYCMFNGDPDFSRCGKWCGGERCAIKNAAPQALPQATTEGPGAGGPLPQPAVAAPMTKEDLAAYRGQRDAAPQASPSVAPADSESGSAVGPAVAAPLPPEAERYARITIRNPLPQRVPLFICGKYVVLEPGESTDLCLGPNKEVIDSGAVVFAPMGVA